tara:strand:+ start:160 stop:450 length:291 start_codon:yes stop_codon:yes gene_type:complete
MNINALNFRSSDEFSEMMRAKNQTHHIPPHVAEFFSDDALEVLQHFGFEAPALLNKYSCVLEDVLIDTLGLRPQEEEVKETPPTKKARRFKKKRQM